MDMRKPTLHAHAHALANLSSEFPEVHGNTRSEGLANARKKCSNKYIGSRRQSRARRGVRRCGIARDISAFILETPNATSLRGRRTGSFHALRGGETNDRHIAIEHTHHPVLPRNAGGGTCRSAFVSGTDLLLPAETGPFRSSLPYHQVPVDVCETAQGQCPGDQRTSRTE